ncbi:MAG: hypothetical protein ACLP1Y_07670 [Candidatus Acidiferrales bacterium]
MAEKSSALNRRIAPSYPFTLRSRDNEGKETEQKFLLCFDLEALTALEEKIPSLNTLNLGGLEIFARMNAGILGAALWAAALRHHPEYDTRDEKGSPTDDGLETISSFLDLGNSDDAIKALEEAYLITLPRERADRMRALRDAKPAGEDPTTAAGIPIPAADSVSNGPSSGPSPDTTSASAIAKSAD